MSDVAKFLQGKINIRQLTQAEISEARKVFKDTIKYQVVFICPSGDAMTWAYHDKSIGWYNVIWWSPDVYINGALSNNATKRTFIHEMTHVWQCQHGTYPREYMVSSFASQTGGGIRDIWDKGAKELMKRIWEKNPINAWHSYRNRAYAFSMNDMGGYNFNDFNVEQQASIIESWYASDEKDNHLGEKIPGGNMSATDVRYPFITCNILASSPNAQYVPLRTAGNVQLAKGADAKIKAIQDILVALRYLDPKFADGFMGENTRRAVRGFQANNGLKVDGDIGGPNSETRKRLGVR